MSFVYFMKWLVLIVVFFLVLTIGVFAIGDEKIIFLRHSTGGNVYDAGVGDWFRNYNNTNDTSYQISQQWYPNQDNYPYDYWDVWINNNGLTSFVNNYDVIIFKHCYPGSDVLADTGSPSISSNRKSFENYKLQYRALRDLMDNYSSKLFIIWTLPPRNELDNSDTEQAARATNFSNWVKTDFLTENGSHPNIHIFDFRSLVTDEDNFLKDTYVDGSDSHPNAQANSDVYPEFSQFIVDAITNFSANNSSAESSSQNYTVVINEFVVDPQTDWSGNNQTTQGTDEWFELYNNGSTNIDLTGWILSLVDSSPANETLSGTIYAGEFFTILNPSGSQNMDGQIILYDNQSNVIDNVTYDDWNDGNTSDNAPTGNSNDISDECLARSPNGYDTDVDSNDWVQQNCTYNTTNDYNNTTTSNTTSSNNTTNTVPILECIGNQSINENE